MSTVRDLLSASFRIIGVLASGETATADMQNDALTSLNRMLSRWSTENLLIYTNAREVFSLPGGQSSYTIGTTGDCVTSRPVNIERAAIFLNNVEIPLHILNLDQWAEIPQKNIQSAIPTKLYAQGSVPLETINLWPIPSGAFSFVLYSDKPLTSFATANDTVTLPLGYEDAIVYNLAVRLAPEYGRPLDPVIVIEAADSKANIKRKNIKPEYLSSDFPTAGRNCRNIFSGE